MGQKIEKTKGNGVGGAFRLDWLGDRRPGVITRKA
jgi:hypothetical protein